MPKDFDVFSPGGEKFAIREGLPEELAVIYDDDFRTFNDAPTTPHVFKADYLVFINSEGESHEERDKVVLYMHGEVKDGRWVPKDYNLAATGVTISEIIEWYERASGSKIDFLYVCAEKKVRGRVVNQRGVITVFISNPNAVMQT